MRAVTHGEGCLIRVVSRGEQGGNGLREDKGKKQRTQHGVKGIPWMTENRTEYKWLFSVRALQREKEMDT